MFVVYVFMIFCAVITVVPGCSRTSHGPGFSRSYFLAITVILFLTVWFSTLSESIAEAQGKAQAESLREIQTGTRARRMLTGRLLGAWSIRACSARATSSGSAPARSSRSTGTSSRARAEIDESMMTGESAAVIRESGGDKTSVLGGSRVLRGKILVRISVDPGGGFLDRMIRLVESATREKSPNELALTLLLSAFTVSLLVVILTFDYMLTASGAIVVEPRDAHRAPRLPDADDDRGPPPGDRDRRGEPSLLRERHREVRASRRGGRGPRRPHPRQDRHDHDGEPDRHRVHPGRGASTRRR